METEFKKNIVIFHASCQDGYSSAWCARTQLGEKYTTYLPANYGDIPPQVTGKNIFIADYSYSRDVLDILAKDNFVQVIDHHITSMEYLSDCKWQHEYLPEYGLPGLFVSLSTIQSGAGLTWKYFNPTTKAPLFIDLIEDRDLWNFKHGKDTNRLHAFLTSKPFSFALLDKLQDPAELLQAINTGETLLDFTQRQIEIIAKRAYLTKFHHYTVIRANSSLHQSELANYLLEKNPSADYAHVFSMGEKDVFHSLRSRKEGNVDVEVVAKSYGGGGHKNAAGFKTTNWTEGNCTWA